MTVLVTKANTSGVIVQTPWTWEADMEDQRYRSGRFFLLLGVFAGGLVYSLLPHGAFGANDFVVRAAITGTVAGGTFLVLLVMTNRWGTR